MIEALLFQLRESTTPLRTWSTLCVNFTEERTL